VSTAAAATARSPGRRRPACRKWGTLALCPTQRELLHFRCARTRLEGGLRPHARARRGAAADAASSRRHAREGGAASPKGLRSLHLGDRASRKDCDEESKTQARRKTREDDPGQTVLSPLSVLARGLVVAG